MKDWYSQLIRRQEQRVSIELKEVNMNEECWKELEHYAEEWSDGLKDDEEVSDKEGRW